MNIFEINATNFGSTGNIMLQIAEKAKKNKHKVFVCCPLSRENKKKNLTNQIFIGNRLTRNLHVFLSRLTGCLGCFSILSTFFFLVKLKRLKPSLIHLHNLHGSYINLLILFRFIKKNHVPVIWTLHDCWSFTGRCPHFVMAKCDGWMNGCYNCSYSKNAYPQTFVNSSHMMWNLKRNLFVGIEKCSLVTPSLWLANLVKKSFLADYPVKVINNGVNLTVFKPTESQFKERYGLADKKIILGVSFGWGISKGLDVFIELSHRIPNGYQIVLVGTDENIDKLMPFNIVSIHRTRNQRELAEIYSSADVFVNPTREEVLGLVNVESLACGTPVITFRTGGSPECIDETCGCVVDCDDIDAMESEIYRICEQTPFSVDACVKRAQKFDMNERFDEYVKLYEEMGR